MTRPLRFPTTRTGRHGRQDRGPTSRGFTLVEMLVVVAILVVVIALVIVATRAVRQAGDRVTSSGVLRQLAAAHTTYALDHRQRLIPGYLTPQLQSSLGITAPGPDGNPLPEAAAATWVWRLAPYMDNQWSVLLGDGSRGGSSAEAAAQLDAGDYETLARGPQYGMNTLFVGGDAVAAGLASLSPWNAIGNESIAATRLSEIRSPANVILFAPTRRSAGATDDHAASQGHYELRAPALGADQWTAAGGGVATPTPQMATPAGLPFDRAGGETIPVAHVDGSVQLASLAGIAIDMRRWSPFAATPDWRVGD